MTAPRHRNTDVVLTEAPRAACVPVPDPFETAHQNMEFVKGEAKLTPNARRVGRKLVRAQGGTPREAHPSQLTVQGHTWDQVYEWLHQARRELNGIPGVGLEGEESGGMTAAERAVLVYGYERVRNRTRGCGSAG